MTAPIFGQLAGGRKRKRSAEHSKQFCSRFNAESGDSEQGHSVSKKMINILRRPLCPVKNGLGRRMQEKNVGGHDRGAGKRRGWPKCAEK